MRRLYTWVGIGLMLASPVLASEITGMSAPQTHTSACSLAESMATKMNYKTKLSPQAAQRNCQALAPTMDPANHAEFMRCCTKQLEAGPADPAPSTEPGKSQKKHTGI